MGQKVNPISLRLGINKVWNSRWYGEGKVYVENLFNDIEIRKFIKKELSKAKISNIIIERPNNAKLVLTIHTSTPGIIIGRKGEGMEALTASLRKKFGSETAINVIELKKPDLIAALVADNIATQIEKRISYKRAMKKAVENAMRNGAQGIKIKCSGRLSGAEIARSEGCLEGTVPLHTLRSDIDYAQASANTAYGVIGVQVWISKGEILEHDPMESEKRQLSSY